MTPVPGSKQSYNSSCAPVDLTAEAVGRKFRVDSGSEIKVLAVGSSKARTDDVEVTNSLKR